MELPLYPWNCLDGSMEPLGFINGYVTYITDFKCGHCILGTVLWIHVYIYHDDHDTMDLKLLECIMKPF